jgi:hypothetical protein
VEEDDAKEAKCDHEGERLILNHRLQAERGMPRPFWWVERYAKIDLNCQEVLRQGGYNNRFMFRMAHLWIASMAVQRVISSAKEIPTVRARNDAVPGPSESISWILTTICGNGHKPVCILI